MTPLTAVALAYGFVAIIMVVLVVTAPEGYEDAAGWHEGQEP